jgi:hypothetical protein
MDECGVMDLEQRHRASRGAHGVTSGPFAGMVPTSRL